MDSAQQQRIETADSSGQRRFPCAQCGAKLEYKPGSTVLRCPYCSFENSIAADASEQVLEHDYRKQLDTLAGQKETAEFTLAKCDACAAEVQPPPNATAFPCPFCGADIVATAKSVRLIKPHALLPFKIERNQAMASFETWIKGRWFAPTALKRFKQVDHRFSGMYLPHWTYDSRTSTRYTGQRGDNYWVTETYTAVENGKSVTRTRQVQRIRWTSAAGIVPNRFDDLLVVASHSLPGADLDALQPWDLASLTGYRDEYLSGFRAESYQVDLAAGFEVAKQLMVPEIRRTICSDIGGDHQQISSMDTSYFDVTFKHLLLPVWISAYRWHNKTYRFLVNARTGEVRGQRPYSAWKIVLFVLMCLALVGGVIAIFAVNSQ
jgi:predicted RNA-binding Zn-ribbon protein involved in translation (DUF1610 family)